MAVNSQVRSKMMGVGALGFAVCIVTNNIIENAVTGRPEPGAGDDEVLAWARDAEPFLWSGTISMPLSMVFLFAFVIGLASRLRSTGEDTTMAIVGGLGAAMMFGGLSTAFASDAVLVSRADELSLEMVGVLTDLTTALFIMNWVVLAITLWALSRAAWTLGLIPRWLERLTLVGAVALSLGSMFTIAALRGTLLPLLVGLLGWAVWVLFLVVVGVRGLKGDTSAATESLSVDPQDRSTPDAALAADAQLPN
jgi:hypothetical protein